MIERSLRGKECYDDVHALLEIVKSTRKQANSLRLRIANLTPDSELRDAISALYQCAGILEDLAQTLITRKEAELRELEAFDENRNIEAFRERHRQAAARRQKRKAEKLSAGVRTCHICGRDHLPDY